MSKEALTCGQRSPVLEAYVTHRRKLRGFIHRFARFNVDIDDILQEAFLRAYTVELERPIEQPKSFLFRIAKHVALSRRDHGSRWQMQELDTDALAESSPEDEAIADETVSRRLSAVAELAPQQQRVYLLRRYEGLSQEETALQLGIAVSTCEKHMIHATEGVRRAAA